MRKETAVIIIDTGFSLDAMMTASRILAVCDLSTGLLREGEPALNTESLSDFAGDPLNHGSLVLRALTAIDSDIPVILVRAYSIQVRLIRTGFENGEIKSPGWTEAFDWAVSLCKKRGYNSVTNCSFGGYTHAMDGSGWEAFRLGQHIGPGKAGHILVAGAGSGDGRAIHASCLNDGGSFTDINARQTGPTTYNLWAGLGGPVSESWTLEVFLNERKSAHFEGAELAANFWNDRKQLTFTVSGEGSVKFRMHSPEATRFDLWINHQDDAVFTSHADPHLIAEPAVFPGVIAVGLAAGRYSSDQTESNAKPEVLLAGSGPVSFRLPEVVAEIAAWLTEEPELDVVSVRRKLCPVTV
ncbi:MAG: hypothetical protein H6677_00005 [Candidatus Obscuribacterales bacterium]|nr:hypothetical protein [Candidatus Obscuribacterales bacterium]